MTSKVENHPMPTSVRKSIHIFRVKNNNFAFVDIILSTLSFVAGITAIFTSIEYQIWLAIPVLQAFTGLTLVKFFTIQHDCGHGSYFNKKSYNKLFGRLISMLSLIPFKAWQSEHAKHHSHFAITDEHNFGDILLLSVTKYRSMKWYQQLVYRSFRSPIFILMIAPLLYLLIRQRIPSEPKRSTYLSCVLHSVMLLIIYGSCFTLLGELKAVLIFFPIWFFAGLFGITIFLVEHQYEDAEWFNKSQWDYNHSVLSASSHFELPFPLDWMTGYIGYHQIHHFDPKIPSYNLKKCYKKFEVFKNSKKLSLRDVSNCFQLSLWSDQKKRMISFTELNSCQY